MVVSLSWTDATEEKLTKQGETWLLNQHLRLEAGNNHSSKITLSDGNVNSIVQSRRDEYSARTEVHPTPTQYVVNTLYWPHTALSVYLVCYFLVPHTHVLCMGSGSATGKKFQVRLVHSLLKYFCKFQLWYWIKKFTLPNIQICYW